MEQLLAGLARADVVRALSWTAALERGMPGLAEAPARLRGVVPLVPFGNPDPREAAAFLIDESWWVVVDDRPELFPVIDLPLFAEAEGDVRVLTISSNNWRRFRMAPGVGDPSRLASGLLETSRPAAFETDSAPERDPAISDPDADLRARVARQASAELLRRRIEQERVRREAEESERRALVELEQSRVAARHARQALFGQEEEREARETARAEAERSRLLHQERELLRGLLPSPRLVKTAEAAEGYAAEVMRALGYLDAEATPRGPDGGVDVVSADAVAQVKMEGLPTGAPALQALFGIAALDGKQPFFFSFAGYTTKALVFARRAEMACFEFAFDGSLDARSDSARRLLRELHGSSVAHDPSGRPQATPCEETS